MLASSDQVAGTSSSSGGEIPLSTLSTQRFALPRPSRSRIDEAKGRF